HSSPARLHGGRPLEIHLIHSCQQKATCQEIQKIDPGHTQKAQSNIPMTPLQNSNKYQKVAHHLLGQSNANVHCQCRQKPSVNTEAQDYMHCVHCQGLFRKKILFKHVSKCKFKPSGEPNRGRTRVQALCAFAVPPPPGVKQDFWKLLSNMINDKVSSIVKKDPCILEFGENLFSRFGHDAGKHEYIRQKLRELGRLLLCSRKNPALKTIEDHVLPSNFMHVVESVKCVAGYDRQNNTYKRPSLALKLGHSLSKISMLVESRSNIQNNSVAAKNARTFRQIYEARWHEMISAASLRTLQEAKWNAPLLLPFTRDVQVLHSFLDAEQQKLHSTLSSQVSTQDWAGLAKVTLTQIILFNRRRSGEVSKMPLSAYMSPHSQDALEDLGDALSDLEKKLCQHFRRLEIAGKRGRKVPVLLTPAMQEALDLLVSKREMCGVVPGNKYLFARPKACSYFRGSDCLRHFAKMCGAKNPESLTSTKLRKQTATLSQVLNLSNTELDQLADFLGHDVRVHRQFYRLPEGTLQLAKVSKILMALEQGRMAEFKGKGLDDITIDPEDHALQDSEDEDENQNIEEDLDAEMPDETNETSQPVTIETSSHPSLQAVQRPSRKGPSRTPTSARRTVACSHKSVKALVWTQTLVLVWSCFSPALVLL
ncbi:hypothetical protein WMY93_034247, partial [Mugilogobius chulae]